MWEKIKKILSKENGKCIIIENNQPTYLVMKLDDYEKEKTGEGDKKDEVEDINRDIIRWKSQEETPSEIGQDTEKSEDIKVEDLPF